MAAAGKLERGMEIAISGRLRLSEQPIGFAAAAL
jgi:hypothetical protein